MEEKNLNGIKIVRYIIQYCESLFNTIPMFKKIADYKYELFLFLLTVFGLILKFLYVLFRLEYQSDNVYGGLIAIEFWQYHNYFLSGYYLPSDDTCLFDLIVFHLIPQVISNFNPIILKIVSFIIFVLIILAFSYFVCRITNSLLNGLIFSALLSNWYIEYYSTILWIISHDTVILVIGFLLILYFFKPLKYWEFLFFCLLAVITFSDSLILVWFTLPLLFVIFINHLHKQTIKEQVISFLKFDFAFKILFLSGILMVVKKYLIPYYITHTHLFHEMNIQNLVVIQIPILFQHFTYLINPNLYRFITYTGSISLLDIIFSLFFVSYLVLVVRNRKRLWTEEIRNFCLFTIIAFFGTSLLYITTAFTLQLQYLKFLLVCLLVIFCLIDFNKLKIAKLLIITIILINLIYSFTYIAPLTSNSINSPNEEQYELIDFLKNSNLTFGYGDYWDANVITYLSHGDVTIRSIWFGSPIISPRYWNSDARWYKNIPPKFFIIVKSSDENTINYFNITFQPKFNQVVNFKNYKIFTYNQSVVQNFTLNVVNLSHSAGTPAYDSSLQINSWYSDRNIEGYVVYGPYISLPSGSYQVNYSLKTDSNPSPDKNIGRIEVFSDHILNQSMIYADSLLNGSYKKFSLNFEAHENSNLEFRVYKSPNSTLYIGNVDVNIISLNYLST